MIHCYYYFVDGPYLVAKEENPTVIVNEKQIKLSIKNSLMMNSEYFSHTENR